MRRSTLSAFVLCVSLVPVGTTAQSIGPAGPTSTGGHGTGSSAMLSWSVGQFCGASLAAGGQLITAGIQQPDVVRVAINARVLLGGPYNTLSNLMDDGLRSAALIPLLEPYTAAGLTHYGEGGGEQTSALVLGVGGNDAVVDWVFVELRSAAATQTVVSTRAGLVQRDGDVVETDGVSPLRLSAVPGSYHVAVRHRNHLPAMTLNPVALSAAPVAINFIDGSTPTYGTTAQRLNGAVRHLWPGNVLADQQVSYTGASNDRDPILVTIGSTTPNNVLTGTYSTRDVNLDGSVKYTGANNDRDPILVTVGSTTPNNVRPAQLP